ncbi:sulfatase/phosphatase domain-containing protein [Sphingomonas sp. MMS24-JH45]
MASTTPITATSTSPITIAATWETLLAVDEGLAKIMALLEARGELDDTLILDMGDNGFMFGEHGLIDKRTAYEELMPGRPTIARCPALFGTGGRQVSEVVANIDVAPTMLAAAGLVAPPHMAGTNALPLAQGKKVPWRSELLYEYYWERTSRRRRPSMRSGRTGTKYMHFHGIWGLDQAVRPREGPDRIDNLLARPGHEELAEQLSGKLFAILEKTGGMTFCCSPMRASARICAIARDRPGAPDPARIVRALEARLNGAPA